MTREWTERREAWLIQTGKQGGFGLQEQMDYGAWGPSCHRVVGKTKDEEEGPWQGRWFWMPQMVAEEHQWWTRFLKVVRTVKPTIPEKAGDQGFGFQVARNPEGMVLHREVWTRKAYSWTWM